jgi:hypothetical protein
MKSSDIFNAIDLFVETHPIITIGIFLFIASMFLLVSCVKNAVEYSECICGEIHEKDFFINGGTCVHCGFNISKTETK